MTAAARTAWEVLNPRQRAYLEEIFRADQDAEAHVAALKARWVKTPPAARWRWLTYSIHRGSHTDIQVRLKARGEFDPGAGSTLSVLARAGLIEIDGWYDGWTGRRGTVKVKLTVPGRATARYGLDVKPPVKAPPGLMSEWGWSTLARLFPHGDRGLPLHSRYGAAVRTPSWEALLVLRQRPGGPYMEEYRHRTSSEFTRPGDPWSGYPTEERVRITPLGRAHYLMHYACYRELWPSVAAPEPEPLLLIAAWASTGALTHAGLADHKNTAKKPTEGKPDGTIPQAQLQQGKP